MLWCEQWPYLWCLAASFGLALGLTAGVRRLAPRLGMVDIPTVRKNHARSMPLMGGLAVYAALAASFMTFTRIDAQIRWLVGGAFVVLVLGLVDDRFALRARVRLTIQALSAVGMIAAGVRFEWFPWALANYLVSALWLVGVMNAFNCLDCADGVSTGCATISAAAFFLIALAYGHLAVAMMAVALAGACLGFLAFNFPPASIFLGDAGSTLVGFLLGGLAITSSRGAPPLQQAWMAALPLAVPIWDIILVHVRRYRAGTRRIRDLLESAGRDHLPHRLQEGGLRPREVALAVYLMSVLLAAPGVLIARSHGGALVLAVEIALMGLIVREKAFGEFISSFTQRPRTVARSQTLLPVPPASPARGHPQPASYAIQEGGK